MKQIPLLAAVSICLASATVAAGGDGSEPTASETQIRQWVADLADDTFVVRERATTRLGEAGRPAIDPLAEAADSDDLEVATRAVRVLLQYGQGNDSNLAIAALERVAALKNRPAESAAASNALASLREEHAREEVLRLGAQPVLLNVQSVPLASGAAPDDELWHLKVSDDWRGGDDGFRHIKHLHSLRTLLVYSSTVGDRGIAQLSDMPALERIDLFGTKVTPDGVAQLQKRFPQAKIDVRNGAQLGILSHAPVGQNGQPQQPATVESVVPGSGAAVGGVRKGDVITAIDGQAVNDFQQLTEIIGKYQAGQKAKLTVLRNGDQQDLEVELGRWH